MSSWIKRIFGIQDPVLCSAEYEFELSDGRILTQIYTRDEEDHAARARYYIGQWKPTWNDHDRRWELACLRTITPVEIIDE